MAGFKVDVGANLSQFQSAIIEMQKDLATFKAQLKTSTQTDDVEQLTIAVSKTEKALKSISNVQLKAPAFDATAASLAAIERLNASVEAAGAEALKAGLRFDTLGGRLPLQDFNAFDRSVNKLKSDIANGFKVGISGQSLVPPIPASVPASFEKTKVGANQAAFALTNVGRVAQDLPFGFIGIQNNLNPLLEGFQRLRAETGSGKAALSALGQSLIGPAGLGIALSVISAAFLIYQNGIAGFNQKTKEAKDKTEELLKTLKSVGEVADAAAASQAGDIAQVQALANVVTNTNNAYEQRKRALEELKEVNKNYFGDLKLEENQMSLLTARVNEYTQALVAQAILKGFSDEISRVSVELAKQDRILRNNANEVNRLRTALDNTKQSETSLTGEDRVSAKYIKTKNALKDANGAFTVQLDVVSKLRSNLDDLIASIDGAAKETLKYRDLNSPGKQKLENDGLAKQLALLEKIRDAQNARLDKLFDVKDIDEAVNALANLEQQIGNLKLKIALRDAQKAGLPAAEIEKLKEAIKANTEKALSDLFEKEALLLEGSPTLKFSQPVKVELPNNVNFFQTGSGTSNFNINDLVSKATGLDKKIPVITLHDVRVKLLGARTTAIVEGTEAITKQLSEQITEAIQQAKVESAAAVGEFLGNLFSGGDFGDALRNTAKQLLSILGSTLIQIGKYVITAALKIEALKKILENFAIKNPAIAVAAGIGMIALGTALKNANFQGPKFADGGIVTGPTIGMLGEVGRKEAIIPLNKLPQLIGNTNGGNTNVNVGLGIKGRDLIAFIDRERTAFNRIN